MPQEGHKTCVIRPKKSVETSSNVPYFKAVRIRDGAPKFGRAPKISPEHMLPSKMARNDYFRKSMCAGLSRPEVPARVMSYWSESLCSYRLHESRRDREEFSGPRKLARHGCCEARNAPKRSPDVRYKAQKSVKTSSNVPYCKAVRIRDGAPKFCRALKISP